MIKRLFLFFFVLIPIMLASQTLRQPPATPSPQFFNSKAITTLSGTITRVRKAQEVQVTIQKDKEYIDIYLGPESFLKEIGLTLDKGDTILVTGSLLERQRKMLATEIKFEGNDYILRDEAGIPLWEGGGCWFR